MPPSEQNPNQISQPVSNVPEYLHLDPIDPRSLQPKKSRKKLIFAVVTLIVVLVSAVVAGLTWYLSANQRGFYEALEKQLQTAYVTQKIEASSDDPKVLLTIDAASQFAINSASKSNLSYSLSRPDKKLGTPPKEFKIEGQIIIVGPKTFHGKLTESPSRETVAPVDNDKWYAVDAKDGSDTALFDAIDTRLFIQTFVGGVPIGNYNQNDRNKIIDYAKANNVYSVSQIGSESLNGVQTTTYTVRTDAGKLNKLHTKINELAGLRTPAKLSEKAAAAATEMTVWVDDASGRVVQVRQQAEKASYTVAFHYTQGEQIVVPTGAVSRRAVKVE